MCKEQIALKLTEIYCNTYVNSKFFSIADIHERYLNMLEKLDD